MPRLYLVQIFKPCPCWTTDLLDTLGATRYKGFSCADRDVVQGLDVLNIHPHMDLYLCECLGPSRP